MDAQQGSIEARLTELEIKASFGEDTLDALNRVIIRQQTQLDRLLRELARLQQHAASGAAPTAQDARDELPPHY